MSQAIIGTTQSNIELLNSFIRNKNTKKLQDNRKVKQSLHFHLFSSSLLYSMSINVQYFCRKIQNRDTYYLLYIIYYLSVHNREENNTIVICRKLSSLFFQETETDEYR